ncbi:hypothetical protein HanRHA438_Chr13g0608251 [Helianthus annuus]|nr:hypothetical protein HanIR_Chr13g0650201 [Helianthus annuus]KAJ0859069.1 hypothetical protein HanRHA438_Chr13g0608251 [Helianthus annuus]
MVPVRVCVSVVIDRSFLLLVLILGAVDVNDGVYVHFSDEIDFVEAFCGDDC